MDHIRLVIASDIHNSYDNTLLLIQAAIKYLSNSGTVLLAGDLTNLKKDLDKQERENQIYLLDKFLSSITLPTLYITGNHDIDLHDVNVAKNPICHNITDVSTTIQGCKVVGMNLSYCKGYPSLVETYDRMTESDVEETNYYNSFKHTNPDIIVSHTPPKEILDSISWGGNNVSIGSPQFLQYIKDKKPKLIICGHAHDSGGKIEEISIEGAGIVIINIATKVASLLFNPQSMTFECTEFYFDDQSNIRTKLL